MSMKKYLVKKDYETTGCEEFHKDMKYWKTHPITHYQWDLGNWDLENRQIVVDALTPRREWDKWTINEHDLIPYSRLVLENK